MGLRYASVALSIAFGFLALLLSGCGSASVTATEPAREIADSVSATPPASSAIKSLASEVPAAPVPDPTPPQREQLGLRCYFGPAKGDWMRVAGDACPDGLSSAPKARPLTSEPPLSPKPAESATSPSNCTPGYDPCLPDNGGDYDCNGGSGNGPNYTGRVTVTGTDPYGLDRDGDGLACE